MIVKVTKTVILPTGRVTRDFTMSLDQFRVNYDATDVEILLSTGRAGDALGPNYWFSAILEGDRQ